METKSKLKGKFPDGFVAEILTLLDRIEIEDDSSLAGQRFNIVEKHGMTVKLSAPKDA